MTEYYIPTGPSETEFVEKRSRFISHVSGVGQEDAGVGQDDSEGGLQLVGGVGYELLLLLPGPLGGA